MIMRNGHPTLIQIQINGAETPVGGVTFYEKEVKPAGLDGGGPIDTTGMRNNVMRTSTPKALLTVTPVTAVVAYSPDIVQEMIDTVMLVEGVCTVFHPDGSSEEVDGYLDKWEPQNRTTDAQPTANITWQPTATVPSTTEWTGTESEGIRFTDAP